VINKDFLKLRYVGGRWKREVVPSIRGRGKKGELCLLMPGEGGKANKDKGQNCYCFESEFSPDVTKGSVVKRDID